MVSGGWSADFASASDFIGKLRCAYFIPASASSWDNSEFCDAAVDARIARAQALEATGPAHARRPSAALDRKLTDRAVWLPTVSGRRARHRRPMCGNYRTLRYTFIASLFAASVDQEYVAAQVGREDVTSTSGSTATCSSAASVAKSGAVGSSPSASRPLR